MHFWIDKRSQCAYTGRHRVPSSLSAGRARGRVCAGGAGVGVGARKGMAAPVHRFAAVDCPPRRPHRTHRHYALPPMPAVHASRRGDESSLYVEIPAAPEQPTIASLAAARSVTPDTLLRTAALGLHHTPMMAPHLKFGMLVSFALATVFLAGAKYYFDRQVLRESTGGSGGGEAGVVCAAVACVCGLGCALSLCRAKPPPPAPPDRVSSTAQRDRPPPPEPTDEISLGLLPTERPRPVPAAEAPPPYKIAVLMPARDPSPPPPAYSSLS
ncbi:uncharacterized protein LOC115446546 [Manduca sexta]|uniref:Uncharacterized protein n=1 Tax=Manduca sexta TaxID=7130 RepID=A0A921ZBB2_MANSE|nr:uncharacterized protein LOC115446546 [Manduca sexta]XP_030029093.1 uncharacterized protein LOC115446546 [Manduca sexta]KAG6454872.1 hypothetical protein O3G_MSEX008916 [Manduca sexta]